MPIDIPMFRIELDHVKYSILHAVDTRHGELKEAIEKGIDLAYQGLPVLVMERTRAAVVNAVQQATEEALAEHFSPGGAGYDQVMKKMVATLNADAEVKEAELQQMGFCPHCQKPLNSGGHD